MAKAKRPIFIPIQQHPFVQTIEITFDWVGGFALSQSQKNISALLSESAKQGISPLLEISSKSMQPLGIKLSAFNLLLIQNGKKMSVECAFQGSKVFENGGPYTDLYDVHSKEAKTDVRLKNSGEVIGFNFLGTDFPTIPMTAFYDWLYITALSQNPDLAQQILSFHGFSDIAFNPKKSVNCQAKSAALYVSLYQNGVLENILKNKVNYLSYIQQQPIISQPLLL